MGTNHLRIFRALPHPGAGLDYGIIIVNDGFLDITAAGRTR